MMGRTYSDKYGQHAYTPEMEAEADAADVVNANNLANYIAKEKYKDDRRAAYPDIGDQLDMQYHDLVDGTTTWKDAIAKVKNDIAKP